MKIIVIGAGASGLTAAIEAAKAGNDVTVLELKEEAGKKIYATGNGRCNITNEYMDASCYRSDDIDKLTKLIEIYNTEWLIRYMENIGIYTTSIGGYIYPITKQSSTVVNVLMHQCKKCGVEFIYNCNVKNIQPNNNGENGFSIRCNVQRDKNISKEEYICDKVIISCGGKAAPKLGSDGSGYYLLSKLGHTVNDVVPALVPLVCDDGKSGNILKLMQKARINAEVTVCTKDEVLKSDGELQLTDYGVSGIVIFQISGCVAKKLLKGEDVYLNIDFMPDYGEEKLNTILNKLMQDYYDKDIGKVLVQGLSCLLNDNIAKAIIMDMELSGVFKQVNNPFDDKNTNSVLIRELVDRIKGFRLKVIGTKSFDSAQVCSGGVSFKEVTEQMESKLINNLYITGELLDVDGICGGYNLHFAFISGMIAGTSV